MSQPFDRELGHALSVADQAASMMRNGPRTRSATTKADRTTVTDIDVAINEHTIAALADATPDIPVLGEEASSDNLDVDGAVWVVDPIDGTMSFTAGIGLACYALALVVAGQPKVAVVADPWMHTVFHAVAGHGTFRNGEPVRTSEQTRIDGGRIGVAADPALEFGSLMDSLTTRRAWPFALWATVRSGAAVADGGFDACLYGPGKPWDIAATSLLITEAGGVVADIDGQPVHAAQPIGRWIGAATPQLHDELAAAWTNVVR